MLSATLAQPRRLSTGPLGSGSRRRLLRAGGVRSAPAWWAPANRPPTRSECQTAGRPAGARLRAPDPHGAPYAPLALAPAGLPQGQRCGLGANVDLHSQICEPEAFMVSPSEGVYKIKCSQFCGRKDEPANQTQAGGTVIRSSTVLDGRASCWKRTALVHDSIRTPPMSS